jgi:hypothetical protein
MRCRIRMNLRTIPCSKWHEARGDSAMSRHQTATRTLPDCQGRWARRQQDASSQVQQPGKENPCRALLLNRAAHDQNISTLPNMDLLGFTRHLELLLETRTLGYTVRSLSALLLLRTSAPGFTAAFRRQVGVDSPSDGTMPVSHYSTQSERLIASV